MLSGIIPFAFAFSAISKYLESRYPRSGLNKLKYYKKFNYRHIKRFFEGVFSIINEPTQKYKVITIFGLKIKKIRGTKNKNA